MIQLDYQTNNPRWGWSGMEFSDWPSFSLVLGFLSNLQHYYNARHTNNSIWSNTISLHIEHNELQGAREKEGRIHYYGREKDLRHALCDLYDHKSAGTGNITCRINSTPYIQSLRDDFGFFEKTYLGYTTIDLFPPSNPNSVIAILQNALFSLLSAADVDHCLEAFDIGYNM